MDILGKDLILHHFLRKGSFVKFVYFVGLQKSGFWSQARALYNCSVFVSVYNCFISKKNIYFSIASLVFSFSKFNEFE